MINNRWVIKWMSRMHRLSYRATGGILGSRIGRNRVLLLSTTGRKSGLERTTPVIYRETPSGFAVVASNAGDDREPNWWSNLKADPEGRVQVGSRTYEVTASEAPEDVRKELFGRFVADYPPYARYQERTKRRIPVVLLTRRDRGESAGDRRDGDAEPA